MSTEKDIGEEGMSVYFVFWGIKVIFQILMMISIIKSTQCLAKIKAKAGPPSRDQCLWAEPCYCLIYVSSFKLTFFTNYLNQLLLKYVICPDHFFS